MLRELIKILRKDSAFTYSLKDRGTVIDKGYVFSISKTSYTVRGYTRMPTTQQMFNLGKYLRQNIDLLSRTDKVCLGGYIINTDLILDCIIHSEEHLDSYIRAKLNKLSEIYDIELGIPIPIE